MVDVLAFLWVEKSADLMVDLMVEKSVVEMVEK